MKESSINAWISAGASPSKIIMGIPVYGQSYTLANPKKNDVGSPTIGPGKAGKYTQQAGFYSYFEVS